MGYVVSGFCHSSIATARLHFADIVTTQPGPFYPWAAGSAAPFLIRVSQTGASPESGVSVTPILFSSEITISFPICATEFHDTHMPWVVQGGGSSYDPDFLEANGVALASACLVLFWLGRIAGRQR